MTHINFDLNQGCFEMNYTDGEIRFRTGLVLPGKDILTVTFRPNAKTSRLGELIHRAIPYPVLLIATMAGFVFSFTPTLWPG